MTTFSRFDEIDAWKKARVLANIIYRLSGSGAFAQDFALRDQMRRAVISILSNIAEGFGRGGDREFIQFLSLANGSAREVQAQLYVAFDASYLTRDQFRQCYELVDETCSLIGGLMRYLASSPQKGSKYAVPKSRRTDTP